MLISFVGNQDPISEKTNEEGAILTLCRHISPDIVYLLPSAEGPGVRSSTEENAYMTREFLKKEVIPDCACYIRPLPLRDPTDFEELLPLVKDEVAKILKELRQEQAEQEIHLNCSSGTPQMTACWYVLVNSGFIPAGRLWQAHNPAMVGGQNRVREIKITFLEEENIVSRLRRSLSEYLFGVMAEECRRLHEISLYSSRRMTAELLAEVFEAYNKWDLLQYREAYQKLGKVARLWRETRDAGRAAQILEEQTAYLGNLARETERENSFNLVDVYYNAQRCMARRAYADVLARFWRLYEGLAYYRLRERWGVEPRKLEDSHNSENAQKVSSWLDRSRKTRDQLTLVEAVRVLRDVLNDSEFKAVGDIKVTARRGASLQEMKLFDLLEELREKRNDSIVAHGMRPVSRDDAANSLVAAEKLLVSSIFPGGADLLDRYPLKVEHLVFFVDLIAAG